MPQFIRLADGSYLNADLIRRIEADGTIHLIADENCHTDADMADLASVIIPAAPGYWLYRFDPLEDAPSREPFPKLCWQRHPIVGWRKTSHGDHNKGITPAAPVIADELDCGTCEPWLAAVQCPDGLFYTLIDGNAGLDPQALTRLMLERTAKQPKQAA